jgi:hypothetical protein
MADRIRRSCVTCERESLATATAKILFAPRTAFAWFLHPPRAAKCLKGGRVFPDFLERMLAHRPEFETGDGFRCVAGQHFA